MAGKPPSRERLESIAANYSAPRDRCVDPAKVAWIDDPFLADIHLRYSARKPSPLAQVLAFGERVAAEVARTTGGM